MQVQNAELLAAAVSDPVDQLGEKVGVVEEEKDSDVPEVVAAAEEG